MFQENFLVAGLGITGLSTIKFLANKGYKVAATDASKELTNLTEIKKYITDDKLYLDGLFVPHDTTIIILSPGIALTTEVIAAAASKGVKIWGDIELFAHFNHVPVIAITGSNGKSTVTALTTHLLQYAGFKVGIGGNFGIPALDLIDQELDFIVLELSSFQLETTYTLQIFIAMYLNLVPDHMDRYDGLEDYNLAKQKIYKHAKHCIYNALDPNTIPMNDNSNLEHYMFGLTKADITNGRTYKIAFVENDEFIVNLDTIYNYGSRNNINLIGSHNYLNVLASLISCAIIKADVSMVKSGLSTFIGLDHRCVLIGTDQNNICFVNDSKATNPGATIAALTGLSSSIRGKWVLLLGGVSKNADFAELIVPIQQYCSNVVIYGAAVDELVASFSGNIPFIQADTLQQAVASALQVVEAEGGILLAPACASFDQFKNYQHRGQVFTNIVLEHLTAANNTGHS